MKPFHFSNANLTLVKPESMTDDECGALTAFKGVDEQGFPFIQVGFIPSKADKSAINHGLPIQIRVLGSSFAPIYVFTADEHGNINPEDNDETVKATIRPVEQESTMSSAKRHICPNRNKPDICVDCPGDCYNK